MNEEELATKDDLIERIIKELNRRNASVPLAGLFHGLGQSLGKLLEGKDELRAELMTFVFGSGAQKLDFTVTASDGFDLGPTAKNDIALRSGEMELHATFDEHGTVLDGKKLRAKNLNGSFEFGGMTSFSFIEELVRAIVEKAGMKNAAKLNQDAVLAALLDVFPETWTTLSRILFMDETEFDAKYLEGGGAINLRVKVRVNMKALHKLYLSVENFLSYVKTAEFSFLEDESLGDDVHAAEMKDIEAAAAAAPLFVRLLVENKGTNNCWITLQGCLSEGNNALLWLDQDTMEPIFPLREVPFDFAKRCGFILKVNTSVKLSELGCAGFHVPNLYLHVRNEPRKISGGEEKLIVKLLHMHALYRTTTLLARPVINLDHVRRVLMKSLQLEFAWAPEQESEETRQGKFEFKFQLSLIPPRQFVLRCIRFFVKSQLQDVDLLALLMHVCDALGKDLLSLSEMT